MLQEFVQCFDTVGWVKGRACVCVLLQQAFYMPLLYPTNSVKALNEFLFRMSTNMPLSEWLSEQFLNGTSAQYRLYSARLKRHIELSNHNTAIKSQNTVKANPLCQLPRDVRDKP